VMSLREVMSPQWRGEARYAWVMAVTQQ
jgi:hypothetical protein